MRTYRWARGNGTPVTVGNVASVQLGPEFRRGVLDKGGKEAVGGVAIIRYGANAREVIAAVKKKIDEIQPGLPPGVKIVPFYDRSILIDHAVDTLRHALIEEIVLVTLAHVLFLWHFRSILVVTIPLPLAVLGSFLFMKAQASRRTSCRWAESRLPSACWWMRAL